MIDDLYNYYLEKEEPQKSCLMALRSIILAHDKNMTETQKWGMPCFCYKDKIVCYLWTDKKTGEPYILFAEGKFINHPLLERGSRSRMKIFRVDPGEDLPLEQIKEILDDALNLYKSGKI